jgi:hypothetical protein
MAIRDTSAQDVQVSTTEPGRGRRRALLVGGAAVVGLVLAFGVAARFTGSRSIDAQRLRIAEVTRGTFIRDASVNGRVVAARMASTQGGVRPRWLQGSSETYRVCPRALAPALFSAATSA